MTDDGILLLLPQKVKNTLSYSSVSDAILETAATGTKSIENCGLWDENEVHAN
jgi:hypothetical protein